MLGKLHLSKTTFSQSPRARSELAVGNPRRAAPCPYRAWPTQNSLPSGSRIVVHTAPHSSWSEQAVAPSPISRATSTSRSAAVRSTCIRFLPALLSGTRMKNQDGRPGTWSPSEAKNSPAPSSTGWSRAADQNAASRLRAVERDVSKPQRHHAMLAAASSGTSPAARGAPSSKLAARGCPSRHYAFSRYWARCSSSISVTSRASAG